MKKIAVILAVSCLVLSSFAQSENEKFKKGVKVTYNGCVETVWMGLTGEGENMAFCIADSAITNIGLAYSLIDGKEDADIVSYKNELKDWEMQMLEEVVSKDVLQQIREECQKDNNEHFIVEIYFDETGKTCSYMLAASIKLYEKISKEKFIEIAFGVKSLKDIPFTKYYDFTKSTMEAAIANQYYGRILFDVCEILKD